MAPPPHTALVAALYTHSVLAAVLKESFGGATLPFHAYTLAFVYFHPAADGIVGIAHGLWFAWLMNADGSSHAPLVATTVTAAATLAVVFCAQFVARVRDRDGPRVPVEIVLGAVSAGAIMAMAYVARATPLDVWHLYVRSAIYYGCVWLLETASREAEVLTLPALQMMSLVFAFAVLVLPVPLGVVVGVVALAPTVTRRRARTGTLPAPQ